MADKPQSAKDRLIFALDVPDRAAAVEYVKQLDGEVGMFKVGLELFVSEGPDILKAVRDHSDAGIFLDLKLHDIPATVAGAVRSAGKYNVRFLTVHCAGGKTMLNAASDAARESGIGILGVTLLTSMGPDDLNTDAGFRKGVLPVDLITYFSQLAYSSGCAGIVCSGNEVSTLRSNHALPFSLVTPGIRPAGSDKGDQIRVATPASAIQGGADYLVVGRPIRDANDPSEAARKIVTEIEDALTGNVTP